jgi:SsrA-binding protein
MVRTRRTARSAARRSTICYDITPPPGRIAELAANKNCIHSLLAGLRGDLATAKKEKKSAAPDKEHDNERLIAQNRKARHEYEVLDTLECGVALMGSEVKSLRIGRLSLDEAYGRMKDGEVWLIGCDIQEYPNAKFYGHEPKRPRKLLLHRREIKKFASQAYEKGLTLVPLKMYFKQGRAKVLLGICRGRKLHDKRDAMKQRDMQRDIQRAMRGR